jgi:hypothetical protein
MNKVVETPLLLAEAEWKVGNEAESFVKLLKTDTNLISKYQ